MASEQQSMTIGAAMMQEDEFDEGGDYGYDHHPHPHSLSRLSMCTSNYEDDEEEQDGGAMKMYMSRLSIESFDDDADEEFSDEKEGKESLGMSSSESDDCYSLPTSPPRWRNRDGPSVNQVVGMKEYASENEAQKGIMRKKMRKNTRRRVIRERWVGRAWDSFVHTNSSTSKLDDEDDIVEMSGGNSYNNSFSGESEGGVVLITRPKGGRRSLCMDLEEVKACRDLGFELEHEGMLEMPARISLSASTLDTTSSGGNSPIASWRISSPGDDPRDVKARLKVWAQAVALASTSRHGS